MGLLLEIQFERSHDAPVPCQTAVQGIGETTKVLFCGAAANLENREAHGRIQGLDATVRLPLADNQG